MPKPDESVCQTEKIGGRREKRVRDRQMNHEFDRRRRFVEEWGGPVRFGGEGDFTVGSEFGRFEKVVELGGLGLRGRLMRFWIWWTSYRFGPIPRLWIRLIRQFSTRCLGLRLRMSSLSVSIYLSVCLDFSGAELFFYFFIWASEAGPFMTNGFSVNYDPTR